VRFQIGRFPLSHKFDPNLFFFPILLPLLKVRHDAAVSIVIYVKKHYVIIFFTIYYGEGVGAFYCFIPTTDFSFLSTPTPYRTHSYRWPDTVYFTYFIAQRLTKLSNGYPLFDLIILHNHNIKNVYFNIFAVYCLVDCMYWLHFERMRAI
jgi:hypothetical protein